MASICLCYDERDEALASRVASMMRARGAAILAEPAVDRERPDIERADGVAARAKASDLVAVIAGSDEASDAQAERALRAAAAYGRRAAIARLDPGVAFGGAADGAEARSGAAQSFDFYFGGDRGQGGVRGAPYGDAQYDEAQVSAFVEHALRAAELGEKERAVRIAGPSREAEDGFGFPRTPAAMLARWRLIEPKGDQAELESFLADYADDPYFAVRAAGAIRAVRRRTARQRGFVGYHATMGLLLAAGLIGFGAQFCGPSGCSIGHGLERVGGAVSFLSQAPADVEQAPESRTASIDPAASRRQEAALAQERRRLAEANAEAASLRREVASLRQRNEELEGRLESATREGASAAPAEAALRARAAQAERALGEARREVEKLGADKDRLRAALAEARVERDRLEAEAKELTGEVASLRGAARSAAADAPDRSELTRLERDLDVATDDLRKSRSEIERLRGALAEAEAENAALQASASRRGDEPASSSYSSALATPAPPRSRPPAPAPSASATGGRTTSTAPASGAVRNSGRSVVGGPNVALRPIAPRTGRILTQADGADPHAVDRVFSVMQDEMGRAARARGGDPRRVRAGLTPGGVRLVQRCLRRSAGAPISVDGVWGRRTSAALLSVNGAQAAAVSRCLRGRLRRH